MDLEWDDEKRQRNIRERGLDFADVPRMDPATVRTRRDVRCDYGETRYNSIGVLDGRLCTFCCTPRSGVVRIISLRRPMHANARNTTSKLPTLDDVDRGLVTLDQYEVAHGEDIPDWTADDIARARPASDVPELAEMFQRMRGERGPQRAPTKERIGLRLDREIVEHFRATGPGWQSRINAALVEHIRNGGK